jgi:hypothetical protein
MMDVALWGKLLQTSAEQVNGIGGMVVLEPRRCVQLRNVVVRERHQHAVGPCAHRGTSRASYRRHALESKTTRLDQRHLGVSLTQACDAAVWRSVEEDRAMKR